MSISAPSSTGGVPPAIVLPLTLTAVITQNNSKVKELSFCNGKKCLNQVFLFKLLVALNVHVPPPTPRTFNPPNPPPRSPPPSSSAADPPPPPKWQRNGSEKAGPTE